MKYLSLIIIFFLTSNVEAKDVSLVIPELEGKIDGDAIRVPTPNAVSYTHLTLQTILRV